MHGSIQSYYVEFHVQFIRRALNGTYYECQRRWCFYIIPQITNKHVTDTEFREAVFVNFSSCATGLELSQLVGSPAIAGTWYICMKDFTFLNLIILRNQILFCCVSNFRIASTVLKTLPMFRPPIPKMILTELGSHILEQRSLSSSSKNLVFINYITLNSSISSLLSLGDSSSHHQIMTSLNTSFAPSLLLSLASQTISPGGPVASLNDSDHSALIPQPTTRCELVYNKNLGGTAGQVLLFFIKAIIALVGFGGNYLVIVVYKRKRGCHPSEFLILSIAIVDFLFCTLNLMFLVFLCMSPILGYINNTSICTFFGCFINSASYTFTTFSSLFLICVITINRYVAICKPHDYTTYFSE